MAVQVHPTVVTVDTVALPPVEATEMSAGVTVKLHAIPDWVTVNGRPAMVMVPVRSEVVAFERTVTTTVPFPVPEAPDATISQVAPLAAVQGQELSVVTAIVTVSPEALEVRVAGEMA